MSCGSLLPHKLTWPWAWSDLCKCIRLVSSEVDSMLCFVTLMRHRWPSHMDYNPVIISMNLSQNALNFGSIFTSSFQSCAFCYASLCSSFTWRSNFVCQSHISLYCTVKASTVGFNPSSRSRSTIHLSRPVPKSIHLFLCRAMVFFKKFIINI